MPKCFGYTRSGNRCCRMVNKREYCYQHKPRYTIADAPFCGANMTYPVGSIGRARSAIAYATKYGRPKYRNLTPEESERIIACAKSRIRKIKDRK